MSQGEIQFFEQNQISMFGDQLRNILPSTKAKKTYVAVDNERLNLYFLLNNSQREGGKLLCERMSKKEQYIE